MRAFFERASKWRVIWQKTVSAPPVSATSIRCRIRAFAAFLCTDLPVVRVCGIEVRRVVERFACDWSPHEVEGHDRDDQSDAQGQHMMIVGSATRHATNFRTRNFGAQTNAVRS